ncbi:lipopolysaccharide export system ATP-binding protein LptB [Abditibacteriota bacterium]|nr:lipopolysaccharide export system ATP-binding protein LptB [Abditibacteriota bacterium]
MPPLEGPLQITATNLVKKYGDRVVVDNVSLEVKRGEVVGLLGPNGAGKTTSFYMIMGLVKPNGGKVELGETDVTRWPMHGRARAGIGYLAQDASVFRKLSVEENIMAILQLMPMSADERRSRCEELLKNFDLVPRRKAMGMALSGGERRRTEIARVLASNPQFILLDEPFTGIDPRQSQEIRNIVAHLKDLGIGILITDHNVYETLEIIDRGLILYDGRIEFSGSPQELLSNDRAREVYFGEKIGRSV